MDGSSSRTERTDVRVAGGMLATFRLGRGPTGADLVQRWVDAEPELRRTVRVPGVNHYTITMGAAGAGAVAQAIVRALQSSPAGPGLRSAG